MYPDQLISPRELFVKYLLWRWDLDCSFFETEGVHVMHIAVKLKHKKSMNNKLFKVIWKRDYLIVKHLRNYEKMINVMCVCQSWSSYDVDEEICNK